MELTDGGWYKTPRIIKGEDFLAHIHDTYASGNAMYVEFKASEGEVRILDYQRLYEVDTESAVLFTINTYPQESILLKNIEEYEFIQYRPQQAWKAIHMGSTKRFNLEQFIEIWSEQTFGHLHPIIVNHDYKFWHVMGIKPEGDDGGKWCIYLKRQDSDFMAKIKVNHDQKFVLNPLSGAFILDDPTQEIKDLEEIKQTLRADAILDVTVSGVPMKLIRVQEIAKGVLFFVFQDEEKNKRYYYNRPAIKLRIVTDPTTGEQKYLLDHIKAMHID
nr:MAG TPA: hypothetical protein [Caudoviricetes sp.]